MTLISLKPLSSFTPSGWISYIRDLRTSHMIRYKEKLRVRAERAAKPKAKPYSFRTNDKGTHIITIRNRKPKWLTHNELLDLVTMSSLSYTELWNHCRAKKITIRGKTA